MLGKKLFFVFFVSIFSLTFLFYYSPFLASYSHTKQKKLGEEIFLKYQRKITKKESLSAFDQMLLMRIHRRTKDQGILDFLSEKRQFLDSEPSALQIFSSLEFFQKDRKKKEENQIREALDKIQRNFEKKSQDLFSSYLLIGTLAKAYQVLGDKKYLLQSQKIASGLHLKVKSIQDHSFAIWGLIELYQSDFNYKWYDLAKKLQDQQIKNFWNFKNNVFGLYAKDSFYDEFFPSVNSLALLNLLRLGGLSYDQKYEKRAHLLLSSLTDFVRKEPQKFGFFLQGLDYALDNHKEIAIVGDLKSKEVRQMRAVLQQPFNPNKVISCGFYHQEKNPVPLLKNRPLIRGKNGGAYICEKMICKLPTLDYKEALSMSL